MTDNEIKKALECCANLEACEKCPMANMQKYDTDTCEHQIMLYSLDLINRQQAEIERLRENNKAIMQTIADVHTEATKEFAEIVKANKIKLFNYIYSSRGFDAQIDNLVKEMVGK